MGAGGLGAAGLAFNPSPWASYVYTHSTMIYVVSLLAAEACSLYFRRNPRVLTQRPEIATAPLVAGVPPGFLFFFFCHEREDSRGCTLEEGNPREWVECRRSPMCSPVAAITGVSSGHHCSLVQTDAQNTSKTPRSAHDGARPPPVRNVLESIGYRVVSASSRGGTIRTYALGIRG